MSYGLYTATQGMRYEELRMDVVANNLANAATPGYKLNRIGINTAFEADIQGGILETPQVQLARILSEDTTEAPLMIYTHYATDFSQGTLRHTENSLDVALEGSGFFVVQHPDGSQRYTRDGHFQLDTNGQLTTLLGWPVVGQNGPIQLTQGDIKIGLQGQVAVAGTIIDTLRLEDVPQGTQLTRDGRNLFFTTGGAMGRLVPANTEVRQGYLEESNVDTVREMVRMIEAYRNYEGYQKAIESFDTTTAQANELGKA